MLEVVLLTVVEVRVVDVVVLLTEVEVIEVVV